MSLEHFGSPQHRPHIESRRYIPPLSRTTYPKPGCKNLNPPITSAKQVSILLLMLLCKPPVAMCDCDTLLGSQAVNMSLTRRRFPLPSRGLHDLLTESRAINLSTKGWATRMISWQDFRETINLKLWLRIHLPTLSSSTTSATSKARKHPCERQAHTPKQHQRPRHRQRLQDRKHASGSYESDCSLPRCRETPCDRSAVASRCGELKYAPAIGPMALKPMSAGIQRTPTMPRGIATVWLAGVMWFREGGRTKWEHCCLWTEFRIVWTFFLLDSWSEGGLLNNPNRIRR